MKQTFSNALLNWTEFNEAWGNCSNGKTDSTTNKINKTDKNKQISRCRVSVRFILRKAGTSERQNSLNFDVRSIAGLIHSQLWQVGAFSLVYGVFGMRFRCSGVNVE